jgi:hypothetical protein
MPNRDGTGPRWADIGSWLCQGRNKNSDGTNRQNPNQGGSGFGRFAMGVARGLGRCFGGGQGRGQGNGRGMGRRR